MFFKPDLCYEEIAATCHTRHVAETCDSDGRLILSCRKSSATSRKHAAYDLAFPCRNACLVACLNASCRKIEPGSTLAMNRCDSERQGHPLSQCLSHRISQRFFRIQILNRALDSLPIVQLFKVQISKIYNSTIQRVIW